ncbi:MAG: hypothetical protein PHW27_12670 [Melioribacteraceae bacterium]|nr:hypothetical protein [Melioribacteraceae bacterium]
MRSIEYLVPLDSTSRYRHYHSIEKGSVLEFSVQCEVILNEKWYPVVRYDTAHGFAHRDLMDVNGVKSKTPLFISDYNEALSFAESDIKANWKIYKERFLRGYDE